MRSTMFSRVEHTVECFSGVQRKLPRRGVARSQQFEQDQPEWGETVGHNSEDRELVPLKSDFDVVWRGFRRSQVQFYIQQTENEVRMLTEDRDSALSQVSDLSAELEQAREEIESLRRQLDAACRAPVDETALSERLRRMVRLANDEAAEVVASARAAAEHEWSRSEQAAAELRGRYERLVNEADNWRRECDQQRTEVLEHTRQEVQRMSEEAEQHRRKLDTEAEQRRTQIEQDFEIAMAARREEAMRVLAERDRASREEAERRVTEAAAEAERRLVRANEQVETMREVRRTVAEKVRSVQHVLGDAEPLLAASVGGTESEDADVYVAANGQNGHLMTGEHGQHLVVPRQRESNPDSDESEREVATEGV